MIKNPHPGRRGSELSLSPLKPDEAMAALLRVKPADVKKLEQADKKTKRRKK